jgi:hypothetical protein
MRPALFGAMASGGGMRVAVLVNSTGLTAVPAGATYVSLFMVDGGNGGDGGTGSIGGPAGDGGRCNIALNVPVGSHTGVYVAVGNAGAVRGEGGSTGATWDSIAGADINPTITRSGGAGAPGSGDGGGGGGGSGGPASNGSNGTSSGAGGTGGAGGSYGSIVEFAARTGRGGDGQDGEDNGFVGSLWGGGGGGGGAEGEGASGAKGGCLLLFTDATIAI